MHSRAGHQQQTRRDMDITSLITDHGSAEKGREFQFGDATIIVAQESNLAHRRAMRRLLEPHMTAARLGQVDVAVMGQVEDEAMAEAILVGWHGFKKDGADFPYSKENALWLLQNVAMLRSFVVSVAKESALFTRASVEQAKELLKKSSDGNLNGANTPIGSESSPAKPERSPKR